MKTPRTDQLLELISANKLGDKSAFEEAISLCESLETELFNRQSDIVKPITKSPVTDKFPTATKIKQLITGQVCMGTYGLVELEVIELEKQNKQMLEALEGVVRVADRATQEFDAARAAIQYAKGETK